MPLIRVTKKTKRILDEERLRSQIAGTKLVETAILERYRHYEKQKR